MTARIVFALLFILTASCATHLARPSEKIVYLSGMAAEGTIELEVDGQPVTLKKHVGCEAHNYMKAGIDPDGEIHSVGVAASYQLPTGEYVVAAMPTTCHRGNKIADEKGNLLPRGYLPWIAIFDKGPVPDRIVVYASERAYKASGARIKFKGVSLRHRSIAASEKIDFPQVDQFDWFFTGPGRKGRGPYYWSFVMQEASMTPEFAKKIEELSEGKTGVQRVMNRYTAQNYEWVRQYLRKGNPLKKGRTMKEVIFPHLKTVKYNESVSKSEFNSLTSSFVLPKKFDWNADTLTLTADPAYEGMLVYYRYPSEVYSERAPSTMYDRQMIMILPSGEQYVHYKQDAPLHQFYDTKVNKTYLSGGRDHSTSVLSGRLKKYNWEQVTY